MHIDANALNAKGDMYVIIHMGSVLLALVVEGREGIGNTLKYQNKYTVFLKYYLRNIYFLVFIFLERVTISMVNPKADRHGGLEDK